MVEVGKEMIRPEEECYCSSCGSELESFVPAEEMNSQLRKDLKTHNQVLKITLQKTGKLLVALKDPYSPEAVSIDSEIENHDLTMGKCKVTDSGVLVTPKYVEGICNECDNHIPVRLTTEFIGDNLRTSKLEYKLSILKGAASPEAVEKMEMVTGESYPSERFNPTDEFGGDLPEQKIHTPDSVVSQWPFKRDTDTEDDQSKSPWKSALETKYPNMFSGEQDFSISIAGEVDTDDVDAEELVKELEGDDQDNEDKSTEDAPDAMFPNGIIKSPAVEDGDSMRMRENGEIVEYRVEKTEDGYEVFSEIV